MREFELEGETASAAEILAELRARDAIRQSMAPLVPKVTASRYTVTCVPAELTPDAHLWALTVELRRDGRWIVSNGSEWLDADCDWHVGCGVVYEQCAHDFDTAMQLANAVSPHMTVMGRTPEMVIAAAKENPRG